MDPVLAGGLLTAAVALVGLLFKQRTDHATARTAREQADDAAAAALRDDLQGTLKQCWGQLRLEQARGDHMRDMLADRDRSLSELATELERLRRGEGRRGWRDAGGSDGKG